MKPAKTQQPNLAVVDVETRMKIWHAQRQEIRDNTLDEGHRREVLNRFLRRVDDMLSEASLQFARGLRGNSQEWDDGPEPPEFVVELEPWMEIVHKRIKSILTDLSEDGNTKLQDIESLFQSLLDDGRERSYQLGLIAGARLAGYPDAKIRHMIDYLAQG